MDNYNAELNRVLRYSHSDAAAMLEHMATDPEHLKPKSNLRMVAADAFQEAGDHAFADYLRSDYPLAAENGRVLPTNFRLHRLLSELNHRTATGDNYSPVIAEAGKELRRVGRTHEAEILHNTTGHFTYENGVVRGAYPEYAWPGGYPLYYGLASGDVMCPECRNGGNGSRAMVETGMEADPDWHVITGGQAHMEGPPLQCAHCYKQIESAYGDPDAEEGQ